MGCGGSKSAGVVETVSTGGDSNVSNTMLDHAQSPKAQGEDREGASPALKIAVMSIEGLRCADSVFVEAQIEGQPASKMKTPTVPGRSRTHGIGAQARETLAADLKCELAFKEYTVGAAVNFIVRDSDPTNVEALGSFTLPAVMVQSQYWGKIPMADQGDGSEAWLEVRVGEWHILVETAQEITNAISDAVEDIQETVADARAEITDVVGETAKEVKQGMLDRSQSEVDEAMSQGCAEASDIANQAVREVKDSVADNVGEICQVIDDAVQEVDETNGMVCCKC